MKQISPLLPSDFTVALQIERTSHSFPWSEKTFLSNQGSHYLNFKMMEDNNLIGFVISHVIADEATLFNIAVDPQFQRKGYGRALIEYWIDELKKQAITMLWLEVRRSNVSAIKLYEQQGFNQVTVRRDYYPTHTGREDAIVMALMI